MRSVTLAFISASRIVQLRAARAHCFHPILHQNINRNFEPRLRTRVASQGCEPKLQAKVVRRILAVPLTVCPECRAEIHVDEDVDKGETLRCEECDVMLEVVGLDPIELDLAPEDEEDDYDEDEY